MSSSNASSTPQTVRNMARLFQSHPVNSVIEPRDRFTIGHRSGYIVVGPLCMGLSLCVRAVRMLYVFSIHLSSDGSEWGLRGGHRFKFQPATVFSLCPCNIVTMKFHFLKPFQFLILDLRWVCLCSATINARAHHHPIAAITLC